MTHAVKTSEFEEIYAEHNKTKIPVAKTTEQSRKDKLNSDNVMISARASNTGKSVIKYKIKKVKNTGKKTQQRVNSTPPPTLQTTTVHFDREPKTTAEANYIAMRRNIKYRNKDTPTPPTTTTATMTTTTT